MAEAIRSQAWAQSVNDVWTVADLMNELAELDPEASISICDGVYTHSMARIDVSDDGSMVSIQAKAYECGYPRGWTSWRQAVQSTDPATPPPAGTT